MIWARPGTKRKSRREEENLLDSIRFDFVVSRLHSHFQANEARRRKASKAPTDRPTDRRGKVSSCIFSATPPPPMSYMPTCTTLLFSSSFAIPTLNRAAAASTALEFSILSFRSNLRASLSLVTVRTYAKGKIRKMPPKKAVKEEKILLGRPGNSLKSGIVSRPPCYLFYLLSFLR